MSVKTLLDNPGFVAIISSIFGGVGLKIIGTWFERSNKRISDGASIREELRTEITSLRSQLVDMKVEETRLEKEIDNWKEKYYIEFAGHQQTVTELTIAMDKLKTSMAQVMNGGEPNVNISGTNDTNE